MVGVSRLLLVSVLTSAFYSNLFVGHFTGVVYGHVLEMKTDPTGVELMA